MPTTAALTTPVVAPDPVKIVGLAAICVIALRRRGLSDADILARFTMPDPKEDAFYERVQILEDGYVFAPALAVKGEMRRFITDAPSTSTPSTIESWESILAGLAS
jgi:hypothetical protein